MCPVEDLSCQYIEISEIAVFQCTFEIYLFLLGFVPPNFLQAFTNFEFFQPKLGGQNQAKREKSQKCIEIKTRNLFDSNQQESPGINRNHQESTGIKSNQNESKRFLVLIEISLFLKFLKTFGQVFFFGYCNEVLIWTSQLLCRTDNRTELWGTNCWRFNFRRSL